MAIELNKQRSDEELVEVYQLDPDCKQAPQAVAELLGRYQSRLFAWCFRYVRDHDLAMDMAQETLLLAYRKLDTFKGRSSFGSWLFVIARNCCLGSIRRQKITEVVLDDFDQTPSDDRGPDEALLDQLAEQEFLTMVDEVLDPLERQALWLRCFEKQRVDVITSVLKIESVSGARVVLQRARRKLRKALDLRPKEDGK